jgi:sugar/nucleoside kinase (ribokinase family)
MSDGRNGWIALLDEAQDLGIYTNMELVTLPADRQRELAVPCLPFLNSVIVNELEAGALTNITYEVATADAAVDWHILEDMAQGLIELGCRSLAVIHTPAGAVAADPSGRIWRQGSVRVPKDRVRGTTGAGDAFAAGVLFGIHHDWQINDCLRLGSASAAACIADTHTSAGIHAAEQCLKAADELGYRDPT